MCGQWALGMVSFLADPSNAEVFVAVFVGLPPRLRYIVVSSTVIGSEGAIIPTQLRSDLLFFLITITSDGRQVSA